MLERFYRYIIVGGGLAGAKAVEGIREKDKEGSILLIGNERHYPYDRPPLSKKLWFGKKKVDEIYVFDTQFYAENEVDLEIGREVTKINPKAKTIVDDLDNDYTYGSLLLATGGNPRRLTIPGGELEGICYYRYLNDYLWLKERSKEGKSVVVIGGGFIGSEMAAALNINKLDVSLIYPSSYLVPRVFPENLGRALQQYYIDKGIHIYANDTPVSIEKQKEHYITKTKNGTRIESDLVVVGVGIDPSTELAESAGLKVENGIVVNETLQSSNPDIYAAGDNANFPYTILGDHRRVEHWDNAFNQGRYAGINMAGGNEPYHYMPYFFSDLFEFGYEAVGDVSSKLQVFEDWQEEYKTGVIYYLQDNKVRGAMMCNVWEKVDAARKLIQKAETVKPEDLRGRIK